MATLLVQNEQDSKFLDSWNKIPPQNIYNKNKSLFRLDNYEIFTIDESYNLRPDKVAYKVYGVDYYYPIILVCNNIGSLLQFTIDKVGTSVYYLKPELLNKILI